MHRAFASGLAMFFVVVAGACTGDDPTLSSSGAPPDGGGAGGSAPGASCAAASTCASGACVDGVCCESGCTGLCEACNVPGQEGRCVAVTGKPRHGKCDGEASGPCAGTCNGTERASCTYSATECGAGSCAGGSATPPAICKAGTCPAVQAQKCALGCFENGCLGVKQVAGGYYHTCAVLTDGKVRCWGKNDAGQVGQPVSTAVQPTPREVPNLSGVESVAATFQTTCALLKNGTVQCWGSNEVGELGRGTVDAAGTVHPVPAPVTGVTGATFLAVGSGGFYCAIVASGNVKCWGSNFYGMLGDGTTGPNSGGLPVTVCKPESAAVPCAPMTGATFVARGDNHTCAIYDSGKVACWGHNSVGQVGQSQTGNVSFPFPKTLPNITATSLAAGNQLTCAAVTGGGGKCWGTNFGVGRLGNCMNDSIHSEPVSVYTNQACTTPLAGVTAFSTIDESACAIANGAAKCWGSNSGGQLGDGNASAAQNYAATTAIGSGAVAIGSGGGVHFAVIVDGVNRDIRCWGAEENNQCGDGTTSGPRSTPIAPKW